MYQQKQKELLKQYEKQEKKLKELKAGGKSTKQAVSSWRSSGGWGMVSFRRKEKGDCGTPACISRVALKDVDFSLSPSCPGEANKGSPDSKAAEMPTEKPG